MPTLIEQPVKIQAAGNKPKLIEEFAGLVSNQESRVSIAKMIAPEGWIEPWQQPEFDEYTVVLRGAVRVHHEGDFIDVHAGQAILTRAGERVRYETLVEAEYVAVCLPAFSPSAVHRDEE
jgi:quercetin dioxygenase-like cupin family protein